MINFNQFRIFFYVAKNMSFTLAASELFITQPAVTNQVKTLEDVLNFKLFKKRANKIYLTEEGKLIYPYAKRIVELEKEIEIAVKDINKLYRGILRFGTTTTFVPLFMSSVVKNFNEKYPNIKIQISEGSSLSIIHRLVNFENDVGLIAKVEDHPEINFIHIITEEVPLIVGPDHPFAKKDSISFQEMSKEPIIIKDKGSGTRKLVIELFTKHNCTPNILLETSNTEFMKQLVHRREGISFLVKSAIIDEVKKGKLHIVPIVNEKIELDVYFAYFKNHSLSLVLSAFFESTKTMIDEGGLIASPVPSWRDNFPASKK
jgi:DNA-binding transcriptional LysR family regulator